MTRLIRELLRLYRWSLSLVFLAMPAQTAMSVKRMLKYSTLFAPGSPCETTAIKGNRLRGYGWHLVFVNSVVPGQTRYAARRNAPAAT
jgi:hypothetical protein